MRKLLILWILNCMCSAFAQAEGHVLSFSDIENLIEKNDLRSIESFLSVLPNEYKNQYSLVFNSRGLQDGTPQDPRAILFSKNGNLFFSFNGNESEKGFYNIETIEFDDQSAQFKAREIQFSADQKIKPRIVENPVACVRCHGYSTKPIWDAYLFWPGIYGSEDDRLKLDNPFPEGTLFETFQKTNRNLGRYKYLLDIPTQPAPGTVDIPRPNLDLGVLLTNLNFKAIAKKLREQSGIKPFRYAIIASAFQCESVIESMPTQIAPLLLGDYESVSAETKTLLKESLEERVQRHKTITGGPLENPRTIRDYTEMEGLEYEHETVTAQLRYLVEGLGVTMKTWSTELNPQYYTFANGEGGTSDISFYLADELLDKVEDSEILKEIKKYNNGASGYTHYPPSKEICDDLKAKSLQTLKNITASDVPSSKYKSLYHPEKAPSPLAFSKCLFCHGRDPGQELGKQVPPRIYYDDPLMLELQIAANPDLARKIVGVIEDSPPSGLPKMPPTGDLEDREKSAIKDYIKQFYP
jgi:hypothetical protein